MDKRGSETVIICDFDDNLMEECASGSLFLMII